MCLFIRSCWRVAELKDGFNGPLASKEDMFIVLDSIPVVIMSMLLTVLHPKFWSQPAKAAGLVGGSTGNYNGVTADMPIYLGTARK